MPDRILLSGDAQTGTDKLLLSGDAQSGGDGVLIQSATYLEPAAGGILFVGNTVEIIGLNPIQVNLAYREVLRSTGTGATEINILLSYREVLHSTSAAPTPGTGKKRMSFM